MAKEIERKFLVRGSPWTGGSPGVRYRQGYLSFQPDRSVRVRSDGARGTLTIKGRTTGAARDEFEYEIPLADAEILLDQMCARPLIEKTRYRIPYGGWTWEIDVFEGDNQGLVVAEVELPREDAEVLLPPWAAGEVTQDPRYYNSSLAQRPYRTW